MSSLATDLKLTPPLPNSLTVVHRWLPLIVSASARPATCYNPRNSCFSGVIPPISHCASPSSQHVVKENLPFVCTRTTRLLPCKSAAEAPEDISTVEEYTTQAAFHRNLWFVRLLEVVEDFAVCYVPALEGQPFLKSSFWTAKPPVCCSVFGCLLPEVGNL